MSSASDNLAKLAKDVPWIFKTPPELSDAARELLEQYSHIPKVW